MPIQFDKPIWLLLLLLIVPCFFMARRSIGGLSRAKATTIFALRTIVILLLATALAHPVWEKRGEGVTVTILLDRSQSVPLPLKSSSVNFLRKAVEADKNPEDRVAVITIAKDANIVAMPDQYSAVAPGSDEGDLTATNLAAGLRTALAIMPNDTANRIVLASDGNETMDSVMTAAEIARANNVPIDVLILEYEHDREVIFERIIAPAHARVGQTINLRMVLRAQHDTSGTIHLRLNGEPIDLDTETPGDGWHRQITAGPANVFPITLKMEKSGPMQFDAVFDPDNPADDGVDRNNSAVAVTFVTGEGKILIVDDGTSESESLIRALEQSKISVDVKSPGQITGPVMLAGYDAVVLANIPRHAFDDSQDKALRAYVHDLGGGLVMLAGPDSFGAGGWIDSEVSKALPVKLDPPQTRQQVRGALALVMHSCEMPQGNYWGQQVAIAAINALSSLDYVGIVVYNWGGGGGQNINNASWALDMTVAGDKSIPINAAKKMNVGDMPSFEDSMALAFQGLMAVRAGQRHVIIISDGDPQPPTAGLLNQYVTNNITVTTVMVGGHGTAGDLASMRNTATVTGGRFYNITNPKNLPQIFIKEAQVVSRSLIQEGDVYQPRFVSRLPGPTEGFASVPAVDGYVLTAMREGLAQVPLVINTSEGADPLYAHWNYGLGKSIAYTSDIRGRWGSRWVSWDQFRSFWEQSLRWVMRPSSPANLMVTTRQEGDRAVVEVEAVDVNAAFVNFLQTSAVVLGPDNTASPLSLQQTGPGKYRGEFRTNDAGAYLVNINYSTGSGETAVKGNLQAAVTVPYSREFRDVRHNAALLKDLADSTKGRVLTAGSPEVMQLFDRQGLEVPKSPKEIWDILAMIAAALFVFDVAARRLTVDPKWLLGLAGRAVGKRGDASTDTVAAWKRVKVQKADAKPQRKAKSDEPDRSARFEATEQDARKAIDVGGEIPREMRTAQQPEIRKPTPQQQPPQEEGDYTSRLLAAKRRARGGDGEDKPKT